VETTLHTETREPPRKTNGWVVARRLWFPALVGGWLGGLALIVVMLLVTGASGMGYATPLNLGIPAFVYTITPPANMLPALMGRMGVHVPQGAMAQLAPALRGGHVSPMMAHQFAGMLLAMRVPAAKVQMMGQMMTGHATNGAVKDLLAGMSPSARHAVMRAMPVTTNHVAASSVLHFAYSGLLGVLFALVIIGAAWRVPALRAPVPIVGSSVLGGAVVYVVNRLGTATADESDDGPHTPDRVLPRASAVWACRRLRRRHRISAAPCRCAAAVRFGNVLRCPRWFSPRVVTHFTAESR
jgi:hypothetical protein